MTPNEIAQAARDKVAKDGPEVEAVMKAAWMAVAAMIEKFWLASNSPDKHYHMSQANRRARLAFLKAYLDGKTLLECESAAIVEARI